MNNFVLTIGCTAVVVYCKDDVGLKIFDSLARDIYGRSHPPGTCVLLEVSSLNSLVNYFQSIHNNDIFELKGVKINKGQNTVVIRVKLWIHALKHLTEKKIKEGPYYLCCECNRMLYKKSVLK